MKKNLLHQVYRRLSRAFGPQHWWPGETPFEVMVGAILTQNCAWVNVESAIANLKAADLLDPHKLLACPARRLARLIKPSGYFNVKARRLRSFLAWLVSTTDGDIQSLRRLRRPQLREKLLAVPGVGPETADSILLYALGRRVFVVDAYTRRFLSRHGLIQASSSYDEIQEFFEDNLPASIPLYNEYHALIVNLGKDICKPRPLCDACPLRPLLGPPRLTEPFRNVADASSSSSCSNRFRNAHARRPRTRTNKPRHNTSSGLSSEEQS